MTNSSVGTLRWTSSLWALYTQTPRALSFRQGGKSRKSWVSLSPLHTRPPPSAARTGGEKSRRADFPEISKLLRKCSPEQVVRWKTKARSLHYLPTCSQTKHHLSLHSHLWQGGTVEGGGGQCEKWGLCQECAFHHQPENPAASHFQVRNPGARHARAYTHAPVAGGRCCSDRILGICGSCLDVSTCWCGSGSTSCAGSPRVVLHVRDNHERAVDRQGKTRGGFLYECTSGTQT